MLKEIEEKLIVKYVPFTQDEVDRLFTWFTELLNEMEERGEIRRR